REVRHLPRLERERVGHPRPAGDAEDEVGACGAADVERLDAAQPLEQRAGRRLQVGLRQRELAAEERRVDEAEEELASAVAGDGLEQLEARAGLVAARR